MNKIIGMKMHIVMIGISLLTLFALCTPNLVDRLDELMLLEKKSPGYYYNLSKADKRSVYRPVVDLNSKNLLINVLEDKKYDQGFEIVINDDGSMKFSGRNDSNETMYLTVAIPSADLSDGEYYFTDGGASNDGLYLYLDAYTYDVNDNLNSVLAKLPDDKKISITAGEYDQYRVMLRIESGYSSEETFYPMLRKIEAGDSKYEPMPCADYKTDNLYWYSEYELTKVALRSLTQEDWKLWMRSIKSQGQNWDWNLISFDDNTGIQVNGNDLNSAVYGELNGYGMVENPQYRVIFGEDTVSVGSLDAYETNKQEKLSISESLGKSISDQPVTEIKDIISYLEKLNNRKFTIFVSVKEDGFDSFGPLESQGMNNLGIQRELKMQGRQNYQKSYIAVINPGIGVYDEMNNSEIQYSGMTRDGRHKFVISSAGELTGSSFSSILIDNKEYSLNMSGLNFVVYDNEVGAVVDIVNFNTSTDGACKRAHSVK